MLILREKIFGSFLYLCFDLVQWDLGFTSIRNIHFFYFKNIYFSRDFFLNCLDLNFEFSLLFSYNYIKYANKNKITLKLQYNFYLNVICIKIRFKCNDNNNRKQLKVKSYLL